MNAYIKNTEYAARSLIEAIFHEEQELVDLSADYRSAQRAVAQLQQGVDFLSLNPDLDDEGLAQLKSLEAWETEKRAHVLQVRIQELSRAISAKEVSTTALCGSLLQIAKQGISIVYPGEKGCPKSCPDGRTIGTEPLKNVIWQGRNQSMHYEEGALNQSVKKCFAALEDSFGSRFSLTTPINLARHVVDVLGWNDFDQYLDDMSTLLK